MILRYIILFSLLALCAGNCLAGNPPLLLGSQEYSPQLVEFVDRLEVVLASPVQSVERDLSTLGAWQNSADSPELLLLQQAPAIGGEERPLLLGWIPLNSGQVYYLYQLSPLPKSKRKAISRFISDWLQHYQQSDLAEPSALQ